MSVEFDAQPFACLFGDHLNKVVVNVGTFQFHSVRVAEACEAAKDKDIAYRCQHWRQFGRLYGRELVEG